MWYTFDPINLVNFTPVPIARVKEIIELNKKGTKVEMLIEISENASKEQGPLDFHNVVGQESLTRFDEQKTKKKKRRNNKRKRPRNEKRQNS